MQPTVKQVDKTAFFTIPTAEALGINVSHRVEAEEAARKAAEEKAKTLPYSLTHPKKSERTVSQLRLALDFSKEESQRIEHAVDGLPPFLREILSRAYLKRLEHYGSESAVAYLSAQVEKIAPRAQQIIAHYMDFFAVLQMDARELTFLNEYLPEQNTLFEEEAPQSLALRVQRNLTRESDRLPLVVRRFLDASDYHKRGKRSALWALSESELEQVAEYIADDMQRRFEVMAQQLDDTADDAAVLRHSREIYADLCHTATGYRISLPHSKKALSKRTRGSLNAEQLESGILKALDKKFWQTRLVTLANQAREHLRIAAGLVSSLSGGYVSNAALSAFETQQRANADFIKQCILINAANEEEQMALLDIWAKTQSNPSIRRIELVTRVKGVEEWATNAGHQGVFVTLTAPSAYHAMKNNGTMNPKWNGASPRDTQRYLCNVWARARAEFKRENLSVYGLRVTEPHHDATPHWHCVLFMPVEQVEQFKAIMTHYARAEDGDEQGAEEHRIKFDDVDPKRGSAVGYMMKYLSKNIDGVHMDDLKSDESGLEAKASANRARAWASLWRIRQFQFIGLPPVTVYRELRKCGAIVIEDSDLEELRLGCDLGDHAYYIDRMGGAACKRAQQTARAHYREKQSERYHETRKETDGIENQRNGFVHITRTKEWRIARLSAQEIREREAIKQAQADCKRSDFAREVYEALGVGAQPNSALARPWTCVTNCTSAKNKQFSADFIEGLKNELKIIMGPNFEPYLPRILSGLPVIYHRSGAQCKEIRLSNGRLIMGTRRK